MLNSCFAQAREAQNAGKGDDPSHDLLSKTANGVPDVASTNAMRMANLLADQGQASASKSLVQSAIKAYGTAGTIDDLHKVYDPSQPPAQRLAAISGLLSDKALGNNPLAQDMLKTALTGLVDTNQSALDGLLRDLEAPFRRRSDKTTPRLYAKLSRRRRPKKLIALTNGAWLKRQQNAAPLGNGN